MCVEFSLLRFFFWQLFFAPPPREKAVGSIGTRLIYNRSRGEQTQVLTELICSENCGNKSAPVSGSVANLLSWRVSFVTCVNCWGIEAARERHQAAPSNYKLGEVDSMESRGDSTKKFSS